MGNRKAEIRKLREKFKVKEIGIFGSYVRGEAKETSDIDILVEFDETYLSDLLGVKVDLVMKRALKPHIKQHILREVLYV